MKPIPRLLTVLLISALICQGLYLLFARGYTNFNSHIQGTYRELFLGHEQHDILFVGSSRTKTTIHPQIIDSICHLHTYNGGSNGGNMVEFKTILGGYLLCHPVPKMVVLNIDLQSFISTQRFGYPLHFYPFMKNAAVDKALKETGHPTDLLKVLPFMVFPELDDYTRGNVVRGLMGEEGRDVNPGATYYRGFMAINIDSMHIDPEDTARIKVDVSETYVGYLREMIKTCREKKIRLVLTYAPEYEHLSVTHHVGNAAEIFGMINGIAAENSIPLWRFDSLDMCHDRRLFADVYHLNEEGARLYSTILAHKLSEMKLD